MPVAEGNVAVSKYLW